MRQKPGIFTKRRSEVRVLPSTLCVQQPCSNPDEYPENLGEPPRRECANFRDFAKLRNLLQNVALPDKEEAPSSSPGRPPLRFPFVFRESASEAVSAARCPFAFGNLRAAYGVCLRREGSVGAKEEGSVRRRLKPLPAPPSGSLIGRTLPPDLARALPVRADNARTPGRGVPRLSRGFRARTL